MYASLSVCTSSTAPPLTQHFLKHPDSNVAPPHILQGSKGLAGPDSKPLSTTRPGRTCEVGGGGSPTFQVGAFDTFPSAPGLRETGEHEASKQVWAAQTGRSEV